MIPHIRAKYNENFTAEKYQRFLQALDERVGTKVEYRVCETPIFAPASFVDNLQQISFALIDQIKTTEYLQNSMRAVPPRYQVPNDDDFPTFLAIDFALTRDREGEIQPKLIELQGFPSLYCYQLVLAQVFREEFDLSGFKNLLGGLSKDEYVSLLEKAILGGHEAENVVLMDIRPEKQKTYPDFVCTQRFIGIKPVCVTEVIKKGKQLFYRDNNREIPIHRIYNRVIVDELIRSNIECQFDFRDELEVEWAPHPNWFFRISKFSLPYLKHQAVPEAVFLDQVGRYPDDLEKYVLKPLYSFAGSGVIIDLDREKLDAIPENDRHNFLLQRKIEYAPVIETPTEPSKVEIRMMFLWMNKLYPVNSLVRLSKGKMLGVDYNKDKDWVGSSCLFFR